MEEEKDNSGKNTGLPGVITGIAVDNRDQTILHIENLLRDGVDERLSGYEIGFVDDGKDTQLLLLRVPASLRSPHMVTTGSDRGFVTRINNGNQNMSTAQVRDAVLRVQGVEQRVREFVAERIAYLRTQVGSGLFCAIHLVPLAQQPGVVDVTSPEVVSLIGKMAWHCQGTGQHCLDGYITRSKLNQRQFNHTLVFRDGRTEYCFADWRPDEAESEIPWTRVHYHMGEALKQGLTIYREGLLTPPLAVCVALMNCGGRVLAGYSKYGQGTPPQAPSRPICSEPCVITDVDVRPYELLKPFADLVFNTFGLRSCPAYDGSGTFVGYPEGGQHS